MIQEQNIEKVISRVKDGEAKPQIYISSTPGRGTSFFFKMFQDSVVVGTNNEMLTFEHKPLGEKITPLFTLPEGMDRAFMQAVADELHRKGVRPTVLQAKETRIDTLVKDATNEIQRLTGLVDGLFEKVAHHHQE